MINCSCEAAEEAHKINVKGPGNNTNNRESSTGMLLAHVRRKETAIQVGSTIQSIVW